MRLPRPRTLAIALAVIVVGGFAAVQIGYRLGTEASQEAQDRMSVLWPSVLALPVDDRVIVVKAAMTCEVHLLPTGASAAAVAACLRAGAREYDGRHADDKRGPITGRLEQLLRSAEEQAEKAPKSSIGTTA